MLNKVILIGNTTRPIELRYANNGSAIAKTGLAVNRKWNDKITGDKKEEVMFIDITIYGKSAEIANQYLTKGKKVLVEGRLVLEQWNDQAGQKRSKHSIFVDNFQMIGGDRNEAAPEEDYGYEQSNNQYSAPERQSAPQQQYTPPAAPKPIPDIQINDDEIPF
ncbi:MAG: hypothetical protein RL154_408 [Pseudomonadota bacterium]|jgi:single-strand DNA-binding protein